jgi:predicted HicB family RNase H-like nuclease
MAKQKIEDREKFVVRFDKPGVRDSVTVVSDEQHISMNAFILQAIDEKLARGARIDRLLDVVEFKL